MSSETYNNSTFSSIHCVGTAEGSDAVACSELIPICHPRCIGVQFALAGFAFLVLGGYFGLVWMIADNAAATEQQV